MKTRNLVLLAAMLVVGTSAFAQRNNDENDRQKKDKQKSEVRSEKETDDRRSEVNRKDTRRREGNERAYLKRKEIRYSGNENTRGERGSDDKEYGHRRDSDDRKYDRDQDRRNDNYRRNRDDRSSNKHGHAYAYGRMERHEEACPLCYQPRQRSGFSIHHSVQDLARLETRRLAMTLNLTNWQMDKIYKINLKYLSRRSNDHYFAMEKREREIRKVLRWGQIHAYETYLRRIDNNDFCDNCHEGWGNDRLRIAFKINL